MRLAIHDVLPTVARDTEEDVRAAVTVCERQSSWLRLGEQGRRIQQIVNGAEGHDLFASYDVWHAHLQDHLVVPFVATVIEAQRGPVPQGTRVIVTGISLLDDTVGIVVRTRLKAGISVLDETTGTMVTIRPKRRVYHFPLCELRAENAADENEQLIHDYATWFTYQSSVYAQSPL